MKTIIIILAAFLVGCQQQTKEDAVKSVPASTKIFGLTDTIARAQAHTDAAKKAVDEIEPNNVPQKKPLAVAAISEVKTDLNEAQGKASDAGKTAKQQETNAAETKKKDDKRIAELEAGPSLAEVWFTRAGIAIGIAGAIAFGLGLFLRNGTIVLAGAIGFVVGAGLCAFALILKPVTYLLLAAAGLAVLGLLVIAGWSVWKWRQNLNAVASVQKAVALIPGLEKSDKAILATVQTPQAQAVFSNVVKPAMEAAK